MKPFLWRLCCFMALGGSVLADTFEFDVPENRQVIPDYDSNGTLVRGSVANLGLNPITNVAVKLTIQEYDTAFNGDYYAFLTHNGKQAILLNRVGRPLANWGAGYSDDGFDITLTDSAANGDIHTYRLNADPETYFKPLTGTWQPDGREADPKAVTDKDPRTKMLNQFNGETADGEWLLFVADLSFGAIGRLTHWGLVIETQQNPGQHAYVLTTDTVGSGTVVATPALTNYPAGTNVQIRAIPNPGYAFSRWEGDVTGTNNPLTLLMTSNLTVHARFLPAPIVLANITIDEETRFGRRLSTNNTPTLLYTLLPGAPEGAQHDPASGLFVWTPDEAQGPSTNVIGFLVRDQINADLATTNEFTVIVNEVNRPPSLGSLPNFAVHAGDPTAFIAVASDPDLPKNSLTFHLLTPLGGASIDPVSGLFYYKPPAGFPDTNFVLAISVSDNGTPSLSATQMVNLHVIGEQITVTAQLHILRGAGGRHTVSVACTPGYDYVLESSSDFVQWLSVAHADSAPDSWDYVETRSAPRAFYRVRWNR